MVVLLDNDRNTCENGQKFDFTSWITQNIDISWRKNQSISQQDFDSQAFKKGDFQIIEDVSNHKKADFYDRAQ